MPRATSLWREAADEMGSYEARDAWEERVAEVLQEDVNDRGNGYFPATVEYLTASVKLGLV